MTYQLSKNIPKSKFWELRAKKNYDFGHFFNKNRELPKSKVWEFDAILMVLVTFFKNRALKTLFQNLKSGSENHFQILKSSAENP